MRRRLLALAAALCARPAVAAPSPAYAAVVPGRTLRFPEDEGSHPEYRTEWWYVTGWLSTPAQADLGFQITFFRTRPELKDNNPSAFAPQHILIAHAALSDPAVGRLVHDQRVARAGFGLAESARGRTDLRLDDWSLAQEGRVYRARIPAGDFTLELALEATDPPLLNGDRGFSRKGPSARSASYYYSLPQLRVSGALGRGGRSLAVAGRAWLDHEWSSDYVDEGAVGWDWLGLNLDDGGALMLFRMRDAAGGAVWAGGTYRTANGAVRTFAPQEVRFTPLRTWRSPHTGTRYPVVWEVQAGALELAIEPLMDDQENDTRASTGTIYWEGAVRAAANGKPLGRGYLELTGYWQPLRL